MQTEPNPETMIKAAMMAAGVAITDAQVATWTAYMTDAITSAMIKTEDEIYQAVRASITARASDITLEAAEAMAHDIARKQAQTLVTNVTQSQLNQIAETMRQGIDEGLHPHAIARRLTMVDELDSARAKRLLKYEKYLSKAGMSESEIQAEVASYHKSLLKERRETIAHTEANVAVSEARAQEAVVRGRKYKYWVTAADDRVSDICSGNEAAGPIPIDQVFPSGVMAPPGHVACRCSVGYTDSLERGKAVSDEIIKRRIDAE